MRVWIETSAPRYSISSVSVTLYVRVWIETFAMDRESRRTHSHPLREGVD